MTTTISLPHHHTLDNSTQAHQKIFELTQNDAHTCRIGTHKEAWSLKILVQANSLSIYGIPQLNRVALQTPPALTHGVPKKAAHLGLTIGHETPAMRTCRRL